MSWYPKNTPLPSVITARNDGLYKQQTKIKQKSGVLTFPDLILLYVNPRILSDFALCQGPKDKLTHTFLGFKPMQVLLSPKHSHSYIILESNSEGS